MQVRFRKGICFVKDHTDVVWSDLALSLRDVQFSKLYWFSENKGRKMDWNPIKALKLGNKSKNLVISNQ